jgi:hypothetical protein
LHKREQFMKNNSGDTNEKAYATGEDNVVAWWACLEQR